ncbi:hypothetical protein [Hyphococcus sp.]|jgi:hypothetical protein|uniref:hypothetical protein n=1 Tax=Hyphococcus sp. TaxID=2038636 RepID=UPI003D112F34
MADPFKPVAPPTEDEKQAPLARRLLWFAALALSGLIVVAGASYFLRAILFMG